MERQDLDPLDVAHRRDEPGDALDIGGIVGQARDQHEPHPDRLAEGRQPLGELQGRAYVLTDGAAIGFRDPRT